MNLYYEINGDTSDSAQDVVLLHGILGSTRYWKPLIDLSKPGIRYITVDLLGFGRSPKPDSSSYDYPAQLQAIDSTLIEAGVRPTFTLVGHSMGALLALRYAAQHPERVKRLLLFGLPYFPSVEVTRRDITMSKRILRLAYYGPTAHALCQIWCQLLQPVTTYIAPLYLPHVPADVAKDTLRHSFNSYSKSMRHIIEEQTVLQDIETLQMPIDIVYGEVEPNRTYLADAEFFHNLQPTIRCMSVPGTTHQLPVTHPEVVQGVLGN